MFTFVEPGHLYSTLLSLYKRHSFLQFFNFLELESIVQLQSLICSRKYLLLFLVSYSNEYFFAFSPFLLSASLYKYESKIKMVVNRCCPSSTSHLFSAFGIAFLLVNKLIYIIQ